MKGREFIPWAEELSELKLKTCTVGNGNISPRAGKISVGLNAAYWNDIGPHFTLLFLCLSTAWLPFSLFQVSGSSVFKKMDMTNHTYKDEGQLIFLSRERTGKTLAKRTSNLAFTWDIIGRQLFGALPKRLATNLVSCVVHVIEEVETQGCA